MPNTTIAEFPQPLGSAILVAVDHTGPASYTNGGTYATSGESITGASLGVGGIIAVLSASQSDDGLNFVNWATPGSGVVQSSVTLHWFVESTSAEVANGVNLSARSVRLLLLCV